MTKAISMGNQRFIAEIVTSHARSALVDDLDATATVGPQATRKSRSQLFR
jgi:hypothetical protein